MKCHRPRCALCTGLRMYWPQLRVHEAVWQEGESVREQPRGQACRIGHRVPRAWRGGRDRVPDGPGGARWRLCEGHVPRDLPLHARAVQVAVHALRLRHVSVLLPHDAPPVVLPPMKLLVREVLVRGLAGGRGAVVGRLLHHVQAAGGVLNCILQDHSVHRPPEPAQRSGLVEGRVLSPEYPHDGYGRGRGGRGASQELGRYIGGLNQGHGHPRR
mmetsp:Transcript_6524/g.10661  ORF Transcript_6524/g.10661 Transcript_6524/m.10661 type:complete len:215 (-) Transcript_6524:764-1408(-)